MGVSFWVSMGMEGELRVFLYGCLYLISFVCTMGGEVGGGLLMCCFLFCLLGWGGCWGVGVLGCWGWLVLDCWVVILVCRFFLCRGFGLGCV